MSSQTYGRTFAIKLMSTVIFVSAFVGLWAFGSETNKEYDFHRLLEQGMKMTADELSKYRQPKLQYVDPIADVAMFRLTRKAEKAIFRVLVGLDKYSDYVSLEIDDQCSVVPLECQENSFKKYQAELNKKKKSPLIASEDQPFNVDDFAFRLLVIIAEESNKGIKPTLGMTHEWSGVFLSEYHDLFHEELEFPKLLHALAIGVTHRYMRTGQEENLIQKIVAQPENSLTLEWIFRLSYQLNRGDVYLTLLTVENVLGRHYTVPQREILPVTRRLQSFVKGEGNDLDKFGTWYHLFGVILYGYYVGDQPSALQATTVAQIETLGANIIGSKRNAQKEWVNLLGAQTGARLKKSLKAMIKESELK